MGRIALCVTLVALGACFPGGSGSGTGDDLTNTGGDGSSSPDLGQPNGSPPDLATPPDLTTPPDLAQLPDLAQPPPDLYVCPNHGGQLDTTVLEPAGNSNLSTLGTLDWVHWGLFDQNSVDRKANVTAVIPTVTVVGGQTLHQYTDNHVTFSWTDGNPTPSSVGTNTGVLTGGVGNGFKLSVPVSTTSHTLRLYVSAFGADLRIVAHLSDGSACDFTDLVSNAVLKGAIYREYSFTFASPNPSQTLDITWTDDHDWYGGANVTLQAAAYE
jgi:hypothetical protein